MMTFVSSRPVSVPSSRRGRALLRAASYTAQRPTGGSEITSLSGPPGRVYFHPRGVAP